MAAMTSIPGSTGRSSRGRLTRPVIVAEALRLVRTEDLAAVSMRRLADELGTAPMSLYRHIEDRQALLMAMLDDVAERVVLPPRVSDPRSEIAAVFTAIHDALGRDAWAVTLIVRDKLASRLILPALERIFAALRQAGLTARDSMVAYALLWHYTAGELLDTHADTPDTDNVARRLARTADPATHPALTEAMAAFRPGRPGDWYPENLQRLLDGLLPPINPARRPATYGRTGTAPRNQPGTDGG
jgi:AcrR family transcriptional regulator